MWCNLIMVICSWYSLAWIGPPSKLNNIHENTVTRRLHSSRMHTACLLTISPSMHCTGGSAWGRGYLLPGWSAPKGGSLPPGSIQACTEADPPPCTEFLTHASENITLPQLPQHHLMMILRLANNCCQNFYCKISMQN